MSYLSIIHPVTGQKLNLFDKSAIQVLKKYILTLRNIQSQFGGSESENLDEQIEKLENQVIESAAAYTKVTNHLSTKYMSSREDEFKTQLKTLCESLVTKYKIQTSSTDIEKQITRVLTRMTTKVKSTYKLQAVFDIFGYQNNFAPGGFKLTRLFTEHTLNGGLVRQMKQFFEQNAHSVILGVESSKSETLGSILEGFEHDSHTASKTLMSLSSKNGGSECLYSEHITENADGTTNTEKVLHNDLHGLKEDVNKAFGGYRVIMWKDDTRKMVYACIHISSVKEGDRDSQTYVREELNKQCEVLKTIAQKLGDGYKFAFAGDLNLYLFNDVLEGEYVHRTLVQGVKGVLDTYQLRLVVPLGEVNKNSRPKIHSQWHKLPDANEKDQFQSDSMFIMEPKRRTKIDGQLKTSCMGITDVEDCQKRPDCRVINGADKYPCRKTGRFNGLEENTQLAFSGKGGTKVFVPQKRQPFGTAFITDHIPLRGDYVSVFNMADIFGDGDKVKKVMQHGETGFTSIGLNLELVENKKKKYKHYNL